jgi:hypothetical protein
MKYLLLTISVFLLLCAFGIQHAFAVGLSVRPPFGGRITTTTKGNVICQGGTGPVTQKSSGSSPQGDYFYPVGKRAAPQANKWALGLYSTIPSFTDCYTQVGPYRIPYEVFRVQLYGTSK